MRRGINNPDPQPTLKLWFNCGCMEQMKSLADAIVHTSIRGHIVTVRGALSLVRRRREGIDSYTLDKLGDRLEKLRFICGCGFVSYSLEKAVEHTRKTWHTVQVFGRLSPALKRELCGVTHTCPSPQEVAGGLETETLRGR